MIQIPPSNSPKSAQNINSGNLPNICNQLGSKSIGQIFDTPKLREALFPYIKPSASHSSTAEYTSVIAGLENVVHGITSITSYIKNIGLDNISSDNKTKLTGAMGQLLNILSFYVPSYSADSDPLKNQPTITKSGSKIGTFTTSDSVQVSFPIPNPTSLEKDPTFYSVPEGSYPDGSSMGSGYLIYAASQLPEPNSHLNQAIETLSSLFGVNIFQASGSGDNGNYHVFVSSPEQYTTQVANLGEQWGSNYVGGSGLLNFGNMDPSQLSEITTVFSNLNSNIMNNLRSN